MDTKIVLWKSNQLSERQSYKNVFNSFPKQHVIEEHRKYKETLCKSNQKNEVDLSEDLSSFFEKMVSQLSIVTKTVRQFDEKLNKIEGFVEEMRKVDEGCCEESESRKRIELMKDEYNSLLEGYSHSKTRMSGVVDECFKYSACFNKNEKMGV